MQHFGVIFLYFFIVPLFTSNLRAFRIFSLMNFFFLFEIFYCAASKIVIFLSQSLSISFFLCKFAV